MEVELDEGSKREFRFIRGMASEGFLVSPLVENNADVVDLLSGENEKKVRSVAILPSRESIAGLKVPITVKVPLSVEVYQSSDFPARSGSENIVRQSAARLKYPMLSVPPVFVKGAVSCTGRQCWRGLLVLWFMHLGSWSLRCLLGLRRSQATSGYLKVPTQKMEKRTGSTLSSKLKTKTVRCVRPFRDYCNLGKMWPTVERFASTSRLMEAIEKVFVKTAVGQHQDTRWDWSVWSDIEFR